MKRFLRTASALAFAGSIISLLGIAGASDNLHISFEQVLIRGCIAVAVMIGSWAILRYMEVEQ